MGVGVGAYSEMCAYSGDYGFTDLRLVVECRELAIAGRTSDVSLRLHTELKDTESDS